MPVVEELAQIAIATGQVFKRFFSIRTKADAATKFAFMEQIGPWFERFYDSPYDRKPIDE